MTWKDLLFSAKAPPPKATNDVAQTLLPAKSNVPTTPSENLTASVGVLPPKAPSTTSGSSGFFDPPKLPPKAKDNAATTSPGAGLPRTSNSILIKADQNKSEPQVTSNDGSEIATPKKTASGNGWVVSERSAPNEQPIVTSPVKVPKGTRPGDSLTVQGARLQFSKHFIEGIDRIERERRMDLSLRYMQTNPQTSTKGNNIKVFIRKRPITPKETDIGDFDVVRVESQTTSASAPATAVVVYNTLLQSDQKEKTVKPAFYGGSACFDETVDSGVVYQTCAKPLVEMVKSGGMATLLVFGQSGSGKSYTFAAVEGMAARDIFTGLPLNYSVKLSFVELCGQRCRDLMDDALSTVRIVDCDDGSVRFVNALSVTVFTPEELLVAIVAAKRRRQSPKDKENDGFSRHVVCRIKVVPPGDAPECVREGTLTLVDCAGTEKRKDTQYADAAEINASVWALKECIRAKTAGANDTAQNTPYSYSMLTRVLRSSLESKDVAFHTIATISPTATNTEQTLETLSTVSNLLGGFGEENSAQAKPQLSPKPPTEEIFISPKGWDNGALCEWLTRKHLVSDTSCVPQDMNGRQIMKLTKVQLQQTFFGEDFKKADLLYRCLRAETDRVARLELKRRMASERSR